MQQPTTQTKSSHFILGKKSIVSEVDSAIHTHRCAILQESGAIPRTTHLGAFDELSELRAALGTVLWLVCACYRLFFQVEKRCAAVDWLNLHATNVSSGGVAQLIASSWSEWEWRSKGGILCIVGCIRTSKPRYLFIWIVALLACHCVFFCNHFKDMKNSCSEIIAFDAT